MPCSSWAAGMVQLQQPGTRALWKRGGSAVTHVSGETGKQQNWRKEESGKWLKSKNMHWSLFQISAARGRNREGGGWIQVKGKLPALPCSTDLWGPPGLQTNIPHFCFPDVFHCQAEQEQSTLAVLCSTDTLLPCSSKGKAKLKLDLGNLKSPQVSEIKAEQLPKALWSTFSGRWIWILKHLQIPLAARRAVGLSPYDALSLKWSLFNY